MLFLKRPYHLVVISAYCKEVEPAAQLPTKISNVCHWNEGLNIFGLTVQFLLDIYKPFKLDE